LREGGIEIDVDFLAHGVEQVALPEMARDVEKEFGIAREPEQPGQFRRLTVEKKRGAILQPELSHHSVPVCEIGAQRWLAFFAIGVDAFGGRDILHHPDIPARLSKPEYPLQRGPCVTCGVKRVRGDADTDDDATRHKFCHPELVEGSLTIPHSGGFLSKLFRDPSTSSG